jgi:hypothetical protein
VSGTQTQILWRTLRRENLARHQDGQSRAAKKQHKKFRKIVDGGVGRGCADQVKPNKQERSRMKEHGSN